MNKGYDTGGKYNGQAARFFDAFIKTGGCSDCGQGQMIGICSISTGETLLNGYTPSEGEVISIGIITCTVCKLVQVG